MAQTTIGVKNISGGSLNFGDLIDSIVADTATKTISVKNDQAEIAKSASLYNAIDSSQAVLVIDGVEQSRADSLIFMQFATQTGKPLGKAVSDNTNAIQAGQDGLDLKEPVDTSTAGLGDIALTGEQTLNGVLTSASRVVVVENTDKKENGIWVTDAGAWTRATDADVNGDITNGTQTTVINGSSTKNKWKYTVFTPDPIDIGVDNIEFYETPAPDFGTEAGDIPEIASTLNPLKILATDSNGKLIAMNWGANHIFVSGSSNNLAAILQLSGFNKAFGVVAGTVSEGNHTHTLVGTVNTTDATVTIVDLIDTLTDDSAHMVDITVTAIQDDNTTFGIWVKRLFITKVGGVVTIENITSIYFQDNTPNFNSNSVTFTVNVGDVEAKVQGAAATNYKWTSSYEIKLKVSN